MAASGPVPAPAPAQSGIPRPRSAPAPGADADADAAADAAADGPADTVAGGRPDRHSDRHSDRDYGRDSEGGGLPLLARVVFADLGVAFVALIALTVIEVQRIGESGMHLRRQAYAEDLVVLFVVTAVFGIVTFLLFRAGHTRVALVQAVVTAVVLAVAVTSAATGSPKPITVEQEQ